jgi:hypothetical protein
VTSSPWRIASASEIGTSHIGSGAPCQDHAAQKVIDTDNGSVLIAVVCDGAGSAAHSEVGAQLATSSIIDVVREYLLLGGRVGDIDRDVMAGWVGVAADRLIERASQDGNAPKEYSCTLLVAVVGEQEAAFAQIGDGAIVVSHGEADGWSWVFWPQHGEYANQTVFILSSNATDALEFSSEPRTINDFAMFSDGIERMVLHAETKSVNDAFFNRMIEPVRTSATIGVDAELSKKLRGYLGSAIVNARTNDDKTLIMATRRLLPDQ